MDLLHVAVMAKYSVSLMEMTRETSEHNPKVRAVMGDLDEVPANKKVVSVMYLSLDEAARKQFTEKSPISRGR